MINKYWRHSIFNFSYTIFQNSREAQNNYLNLEGESQLETLTNHMSIASLISHKQWTIISCLKNKKMSLLMYEKDVPNIMCTFVLLV